MAALTLQMKQLVDRQRLGFVATVCPDGTPNLSPKGTLRVLDDDHLIFADLESPGTVANLRGNPSIEVNVVDPFLRKGYRFKGKAKVIHSGEDFERHVRFYADRGLDDAPARIRAIVIVEIERARALVSPGYQRNPDENAMRNYWREYYNNNSEDSSDVQR